MSSAPEKRTRAPDDAVIKLRRERKRATDRTAQREHRRRQKLYVEELEARLELLQNSNPNDQLGQVLKENEELRKEVGLPLFLLDIRT